MKSNLPTDGLIGVMNKHQFDYETNHCDDKILVVQLFKIKKKNTTQ